MEAEHISDSTLPTSSKFPESTTKVNDVICSFLVEHTDIQTMKQDLQALLSTFRTEKLKAFGKDDAILQMDGVRSKQGKLARLHFGLHAQINYNENVDTPENYKKRQENLSELLDGLENLSSAIELLNSAKTSIHCHNMTK